MKYIVVNEPQKESGDWFTKESNDKEAAINEAKYQWNHLISTEKKKRSVYVIESVNPDEEAENHFDGNYIWKCDTEL